MATGGGGQAGEVLAVAVSERPEDVVDDNNLPQWTVLTSIIMIEITKLEIIFVILLLLLLLLLLLCNYYYVIIIM